MRMSVLFFCVIMGVGFTAASAQDHPVYVGGVFVLQTQPHDSTTPTDSNYQPLGGTTWGASGLVGVRLSSRLSIEVEPSLGAEYSGEYTYSPGPSWSAHVVARRRDTYIPVQLRFAVGAVEPVVALGWVIQHRSRHATALGSTYFDDSHTYYAAAVSGGLDAPLKLSAHAFIVPTFRMFVTSKRSEDPLTTSDPLAEDTGTGPFVFRYGVGARFAF